MSASRPNGGAIGPFALRTALHSNQPPQRLHCIGSASMTRCDGMSSEHHP